LLSERRGIFGTDPDLIYNHMPDSLPLMKFWLRKVMAAGRVDRGFARFAVEETVYIRRNDRRDKCSAREYR